MVSHQNIGMITLFQSTDLRDFIIENVLSKVLARRSWLKGDFLERQGRLDSGGGGSCHCWWSSFGDWQGDPDGSSCDSWGG